MPFLRSTVRIMSGLILLCAAHAANAQCSEVVPVSCSMRGAAELETTYPGRSVEPVKNLDAFNRTLSLNFKGSRSVCSLEMEFVGRCINQPECSISSNAISCHESLRTGKGLSMLSIEIDRITGKASLRCLREIDFQPTWPKIERYELVLTGQCEPESERKKKF